MSEWSDAPWRTRLLRRLRLPQALLRPLASLSPRWAELAADLAYWQGVRRESTAAEWRRLTASYSVLVYHRFSGELKPGQERIDISPRRFRRQLRALRLLGFRPLTPQQVLAFHREGAEIPRRAFLLTVDDATADCVEPLRQAADWHPQLFVPTAELGGSAHWIDGEPVATWREIEDLAAAGVAIGSHTRHHRRLSELPDPVREVELAGSLADLRERLPNPMAVIAYPNGDHDNAVCAATQAAGYDLAYTTEKGRNHADTDPYRLRRVSIHAADGALAALWKATAGEGLPQVLTHRGRQDHGGYQDRQHASSGSNKLQGHALET